MGHHAESIATAFEQFTLRQDLHHTTLRMWGNVLSHQQMLRNKRAWCPACYEESLKDGKPLYEFLMWSLCSATICLKHHKRLCDRCPHCEHQLLFLATDYYPGYCSRCLKWLGASIPARAKKVEEPVTESEMSQQFQIQHSVEGVSGDVMRLFDVPLHFLVLTASG